jgi:hypothetical protein
MERDKPLWEHDWDGGLRMLQMGVHTHLITCRAAIPLMLRTAEVSKRGLVVEMTDGTSQANAEFRPNVGFYYDLVKANVERIVKGLSAELGDSPVTAAGVTPGWLRSEKMLENFGVTEATWRDACRKRPGFGISESPTYVARGVAALAGPETPTDGQARSSAPASSPTRTTSQTPTEAGRTAGAITPPTAGSRKTPAASTSSGKSRATADHRRALPPSDSALGSRAAAWINLIQHLRDPCGKPLILGCCERPVPEARTVSHARIDPDNRAPAIGSPVRELIARNRRSILNLSPLDALTIQEAGDHLSNPDGARFHHRRHVAFKHFAAHPADDASEAVTATAGVSIFNRCHSSGRRFCLR